MHIDKNWIKQRPQFIVEELSKKIDVLVFFAFSFKRKNLVKNKNLFTSYPYFILPFFFKSALIKKTNIFILKLFFKLVICIYKPNHIWITSPFQFDFFF